MIKHVFKDGTVKEDIRGHVVKMDDAKAVYALMDSMNNSRKRSVKNGNKQNGRR